MGIEILTDENFTSSIKDKDKVVVKYFAGWCGSCRLFAPKFKRLSGDKRFSNIQFVNVDAEKNPRARKAAGVTNLPFFAVFKNGQLLDTVSTSKEEGVVELLEKLN